jgi:hypothetical protein
VLADAKVVGRILQENTSGLPELRWGWYLMVTLATPWPDERHCRDARRGDGEISEGLDEGEGARLIAGISPSPRADLCSSDGAAGRSLSCADIRRRRRLSDRVSANTVYVNLRVA